MNHHTPRWVVLPLLGLTLALSLPFARAQEEPPPPFDPPRLGADFTPGRPSWEQPAATDQPPPRPRGHGGPPRDQWLSRLQHEDPEAFAKLQALRTEDPAAFTKAMRLRMQEESLRRRLEDIPQLRDFLDGLPEGEREKVLLRLREYHGRRREQRGPGNREARARREQEQAIQTAAKQLRKAAPDEQPALRARLRAELEKAFDERMAFQAKEISRMEGKLAKLKEHLETRQAHRDEVIDRRLLELTEGDPLAW